MLLVILLFSTIHLACAKNSSSVPAIDTTLPIYKLCHHRTDCQDSAECDEEEFITYLDCKKRGITALPTSIVVDSRCDHISFQGNRLVSLKVGTFLRADGVEELDFSDNAISSIDNFTFAPFMSLTHLRLSHNKLTKVTIGMLNGLWNLRLLELGHNNIESISPLSFRVTPNLQELRLQFNPLFQLHDSVFRFLPNLEKLDLQDTGLVMLPHNIFGPTHRLHWLSLATNAFENVPEVALSKASTLQSLDLSENDFTLLLEGAFKRLSNLSVLYLNNLDRLTMIEKDAFVGMSKLKILTCSYNSKLNYIDENVFGSKLSERSTIEAPPIERLYLRQNALRTLKSPIDVESLSSLSFVDLSENPWNCDCNLKWMLRLTKETQANIKCDTPQHLRGRTFDTLDLSELTCGGNWTLATFALIVACMVAFAAIMLAASAIVCSRTRLGLYIRAKQQFSYDKVQPKVEVVDLEWDPSADM